MTTPQPPVEGRLTFPPFPTPPNGKTIIAFKDFHEYGIQMFPTEEGDEEERDGLGIPTIEMRTVHDTDICKTETKRKRKARKAEQFKPSVAPGARKEWWQQWEEAEDLRTTSPINPNTAPIDRLYEAATDFRRGRTWPPGPTGIATSWDQFRLFVGLLSNTPVWTRTDKPEENNSDDDDDDDEPDSVGGSTTNLMETTAAPKKYTPRPRARPPYALYGVEPIPVGSDAEVKQLLDGENARREEQMIEFLNDPEEKMKIFLSSYMRKQGLIWSDRNLTNIPRLLAFFINFVLRNRIFPEPGLDRALKRSLGVIELAQKDLILTSKLAKELPDDFSKACRACWDLKADGYKPIDPIIEGPERKKDSTDDVDDAVDEPDPKRAKLDLEEKELHASTIEAAKSVIDKFEKELKAADVEIINVAEDPLFKEAQGREILEDNMDVAPDALPSWADSGWGNATSTSEADPWAAPDVDWAPPVISSLLSLLGPTALPVTHTTGVVECSIRRIKSFTPPPASNTLPKSPISGAEPEEDPDAVDIELERRFAKVVLTPWPDWDRAHDEMPHLAKPRILETSRGSIAGVVRDDGRVEQNADTAALTTLAPDALKSHNPFNDDITVLVDPAALAAMSVGLGVGGTWVQIAHEQDLAGEELKKKKKKKKSKRAAVRYWYIDELMMILPSYHT